MTTISKWLVRCVVLVPLTIIALQAGQNDGCLIHSIANADDKSALVEPDNAASDPATPTDEFLNAYEELTRTAEENIRRGLQTEVTLAFSDTSLKKALQAVAAAGKFPLLIDDTSLAEEGFATGEPVSGHFEKVSVEQAIDRLLKPRRLTWIIKNEVVLVTTVIEAENEMVRRAYDVKKLLDWNESGPRNEKAETNNAAQAEINFSDDATTGEWLIEALQKHSSAAWESNNGFGGTLVLSGNRLIVHHTQQVQVEVAGMLRVFESFTSGQLQHGSRPVRRPSFPFAADLAIQRAILKKTSVNFQDTELKSVAATLAKEVGHPIFLKKSLLAEEGLADDEPISLSLEEVSIQSLLTLILKPLNCTYYVEDGAIWITTEIGAEEDLNVTVYDVRDLVKTETGGTEFVNFLQKTTDGPWVDIDGTGGRISVPLPGMLVCRQTHKAHTEIALSLAGMRKHMVEAPQSQPTHQPESGRVVVRFYPTIDRERALDLEKAITSFVAPETWKSKTGGATIHVVGETLVIGNTAATHRQITQFLEKLRSAEDSDGTASQRPGPLRSTGPPF